MTPIQLFTYITIKSGLRSRAVWLCFFIAALLFGISFLAGAFSARQPQIVSLDVGFSGVRIALLFLTLVWVQELLQKDLDKKTVYSALAYPIARSTYLAGKMTGIALLLLLATALFSLPLWAIAKYANWGYAGTQLPTLGLTFVYSLTALWLESLVILAFTTCMVTLSTTPFLAIGLGLLFSLSGRGLGAMLDFLLYSPYAEDAFKAKFLPIANTLRWFLPDLSSLDWRQASLYSTWQGLHPTASVTMALGYITIWTAIAMLIFRRRALN